MSDRKLECPKCGAAMARVYLGSPVMKSTWGPALPVRCVQGVFGRSFWRGRKTVDVEHEYLVESYRCTGCGYLESYARDEVPEDE